MKSRNEMLVGFLKDLISDELAEVYVGNNYISEPDEESYAVTIKSDGKKTRASLEVNGEHICSACSYTHPEDEFDFNIGAVKALERLFTKAAKLEDIEEEKKCIEEKKKADDLVNSKISKLKDAFGYQIKVGDTIDIIWSSGETETTTFDYNRIFTFPFNSLKDGRAYSEEKQLGCVVIKHIDCKCGGECKCKKF